MGLANDGNGDGFVAMSKTLCEFPDIMNDDENRSMLKDKLMLEGTNVLVEENKPWKVARHLAEGVACLESIEVQPNDRLMKKLMKELRNVQGGGKRDATRFFGKRISCKCLADEVEETKEQTKMGQCCKCGKDLEYQMLMKCSRCSIAHYCSTDCQAKDWHWHKKSCIPLFS